MFLSPPSQATKSQLSDLGNYSNLGFLQLVHTVLRTRRRKSRETHLGILDKCILKYDTISEREKSIALHDGLRNSFALSGNERDMGRVAINR